MIAAHTRVHMTSTVGGTVAWLCCLLTACSGSQTALNPKGPKATAFYHLNWMLFVVVVVIYIVVIATLFYALRRGSTRPISIDEDSKADIAGRERGMTRWVATAAAATAVILIGFVFVDVSTARSITSVGGLKPLRIDVVGHQWWWEVKYPDPDPHNNVETANEIHVPVGRAVLIKMNSDDVIHSFWVPNLDGKKDLIPGHETITWFRADTAGVYRGQCAEFCGYQHAKMAFYVVAEPRAEFEQWLERQRTEASAPTDSLARAGERVFLSAPCALCHSISGTGAGSNVGPDLTHLASRRTIAAGTLANNAANLMAWILDPQAIKPGTKMPAVQLDPKSLVSLVSYLQGLK